MTPREYDQWHEHHAGLFLMTSEADIELFRLWRPLVLPYDLADFIEGSNYLATDKAGSFRTTHLGIIRARISIRRLEEIQKRLDAEQAKNQWRECPDCQSVGVVSVPHLDCVKDGQWWPPYHTHGVFCHCPLGRAKYASLSDSVSEAKARKGRAPAMPLSWERYEAVVPNWPQLLDARKRQMASEVKARGVAQRADLASPLKRIFGRVQPCQSA